MRREESISTGLHVPCRSYVYLIFSFLLLLLTYRFDHTQQKACHFCLTRIMASGASKLIPSDPEKVMVVRHLTPDVVTLSTPFLRFGRIKIGGRGTLVRLQSGSVAVFSPVALTDTVKKETETLGQLKYIVAPDQEHHIFLESWHKVSHCKTSHGKRSASELNLPICHQGQCLICPYLGIPRSSPRRTRDTSITSRQTILL